MHILKAEPTTRGTRTPPEIAIAASLAVMTPHFQPSLGYLAPTGTPKGIGVFASRAIAAGEVVEVAPVIQLQSEFDDMEVDLQRRIFNWERIASLPGTSAIALGYGSLYNHANPANLRYASEFAGEAIKFIAARAIARGEELTINYNATGGEIVSTEDIWFTMCGVAPLQSDSPAEA
jgi:hypothetical protein